MQSKLVVVLSIAGDETRNGKGTRMVEIGEK